MIYAVNVSFTPLEWTIYLANARSEVHAVELVKAEIPGDIDHLTATAVSDELQAWANIPPGVAVRIMEPHTIQRKGA